MQAAHYLMHVLPINLKPLKIRHPDIYVVAYINCSAGVKALSDVICTSGNAKKIVDQVPADKEILFVPDQNLGNGYPNKLIAKCNFGPALVTRMFYLHFNAL